MQVFTGGLTHLDLHHQLAVLSPDGAHALHASELFTRSDGLTSTTLFGLTADSRSDLDSGLYPSLALTDKLLG